MTKDINDILFLVQARLSSERLPAKMIKPFAGTSLVEIACEKITRSKIIPKGNFYLSAYNQEIKDIATKYDLNIYHRSERSAKSEGPMQEVMEYHDKLPYKYLVVISACHPLLTIETIDSFVSEYIRSNHEGMFAVVGKKNYFWDEEGSLITEWPDSDVLDTKKVGVTYEAAHCLYAGRMDRIKDGVWMGEVPFKKNNPVIFPIPGEEVFDIDYGWEFNVAEILYKQMVLE